MAPGYLAPECCLVPQAPVRRVEPRIPEIKRILLGRKRALETRLRLGSHTPNLGGLIEGESAVYFFVFARQIQRLRRHSIPPSFLRIAQIPPSTGAVSG